MFGLRSCSTKHPGNCYVSCSDLHNFPSYCFFGRLLAEVSVGRPHCPVFFSIQVARDRNKQTKNTKESQLSHGDLWNKNYMHRDFIIILISQFMCNIPWRITKYILSSQLSICGWDNFIKTLLPVVEAQERTWYPCISTPYECLLLIWCAAIEKVMIEKRSDLGSGMENKAQHVPPG